LGSIALDAGDFSHCNISLIFFIRDKKLAVSLGIGDLSCHLASLSFGFSCKAIIGGIFDSSSGLSSKRCLLHVCFDHLLACDDLCSVAALFSFRDQIVDVSAHIKSQGNWIVASAANFMLNRSGWFLDEINRTGAVKFACSNRFEVGTQSLAEGSGLVEHISFVNALGKWLVVFNGRLKLVAGVLNRSCNG